MNQSTRHPALASLGTLAGEWDVRISINGNELGRSRTDFEWLEGNAFLIQRTGADTLESDVPAEWAENAPTSVTMIFGLDDTNDQYSVLYADSRNVFRVYQMTLEDKVWKLWRAAPGFSQRFTAEFSDDENTITGTWETSSDGASWEYDFDLIYTRITENDG